MTFGCSGFMSPQWGRGCPSSHRMLAGVLANFKKDISRMKILVTGGGGFIARYIIEVLMSAGFDVLATYRRSRPAWGQAHQSIEWVETESLLNIASVIPPVDIIVNTAVVHYQSSRYPSTQDFIDTNILATQSLCEFAEKYKIRKVIHLSTVSVYGDVFRPVLDEHHPVSNPDFYGATKWISEKVILEYASKFEHYILRLPGVVGPNYYKCWLGRTVRKAQENEQLEVFNKNSLFNNVTDVYEVARIVNFLIRLGSDKSGVFNVGASEPIRIAEVIELIISGTNSHSSVKYVDAVKTSFLIDVAKFSEVFQYAFATTRSLINAYVVQARAESGTGAL